jgi:hypothetical protein
MGNNVQQADSSAFRWVRVDTTGAGGVDPHTAAPQNGNDLVTPGGGTPPDIVMSPRAISGMPTTGLLFGWQNTEAGTIVPVLAGLSFQVFVRDPNTWRWFSMTEITAVNAGDLLVTFDIDAAELYFVIDPASIAVDGKVDIGIAEQ